MIGWNDVAPGIAERRIAQRLVVFQWNGSASAGDRAILHNLHLHVFDAARRVRPRVAASTLDRIHTHAVNAEKQPILVSRCVIHHGAVCCNRVVDRLTEMPLPLGTDRKRQIVFRKRLFRHKRDVDGCRIADRFRQQPDLVVEVWTRAKTAVPPSGIVCARTRCHAGLAFRCETAVHGRAHFIQQRHD